MTADKVKARETIGASSYIKTDVGSGRNHNRTASSRRRKNIRRLGGKAVPCVTIMIIMSWSTVLF